MEKKACMPKTPKSTPMMPNASVASVAVFTYGVV
jgi:hypothetical protein